MTTENLVETIPPLVRPRLMLELTGLSRSTARRMVARGELPKPFKLGDSGRAIAYDGRELARWIQQRGATRAAQL